MPDSAATGSIRSGARPPSRAAMPKEWGYIELPDEPEALQPGEQQPSARRKRARPKAVKGTKAKNRARTKARSSSVSSTRKAKARTRKGKTATRAKKRRA